MTLADGIILAVFACGILLYFCVRQRRRRRGLRPAGGCSGCCAGCKGCGAPRLQGKQ